MAARSAISRTVRSTPSCSSPGTTIFVCAATRRRLEQAPARLKSTSGLCRTKTTCAWALVTAPAATRQFTGRTLIGGCCINAKGKIEIEKWPRLAFVPRGIFHFSFFIFHPCIGRRRRRLQTSSTRHQPHRVRTRHQAAFREIVFSLSRPRAAQEPFQSDHARIGAQGRRQRHGHYSR